MKRRALISVSNKAGLDQFAGGLVELGFEIVSTGNSLNYLRNHGIAAISIEDVTGFPECLDGRVKTLHPAVHAGLLARRDLQDHMDTLKKHGIELIDMVVVNLYPFRETIMNPDKELADCIENIDIGGPSMLRSAAKNFASVTVVCDPEDYSSVLEELHANGNVSQAKRQVLAQKVFAHTAAYDSCIADYLARSFGLSQASELTQAYVLKQELRYGENPQQRAFFYEDMIPRHSSLSMAKQLNGKELSYNNLMDSDAALAMLREFKERPTVVAVKHANPCGIASADDIDTAWDKAYEADNVSIFGGIIAQNRPVTLGEAEKMSELFLEVIIAPSYDADALKLLSQKKNIRLLQLDGLTDSYDRNAMSIRQIYGGLLVQNYDDQAIEEEDLKVVTQTNIDSRDLKDYIFAQKVVRHVKSNAIVLVKDEQTVGIGPGQPNRVTSAKIAIERAGEKAKGAILGSDAFFPFADTVEMAAAAGIKGFIQPGGSLKDQLSIDVLDRLGLPMIFTACRHFKH